jgi:phage baseplate assembly protein gpV
MKKAEEYADAILHDYREHFVSETPTVYEEDRIERVYVFKDGAVVKYEWQAFGPAMDGMFNHRFSMIEPPNPNPNGFATGFIKVVEYSRSGR